MKKLLTLTAVGAILSTPALAVQKCVALGASASCTAWASDQNSIEWYSTCKTGSTTVEIKGEGICFSDDKYTEFSINADDNYYCHCRVISPVISAFILGTTYVDWADCINYCSGLCAELDISKYGTFYD